VSSLHYNSEDRVPSTPVNSHGVFIEGDALVVPSDFVFPKICLATGAPADAEPEPFKFRHTNAGEEWSFAVLFGGLGGLIVREAATKTTVLHLCLNRATRLRRRQFLIAALASAPVGMALAVGLIALTKNPYWFFLFLVSILVAVVFVFLRNRVFGAKKVTPSFVWLAGVAPSVRDHIYQTGLRPGP